MKSPLLPIEKWNELKRELMRNWHQLSDSEFEHLERNTQSALDLLRRRVDFSLDENIVKAREIIERFQRVEREQEQSPFPVKKQFGFKDKPKHRKIDPQRGPRQP